MTFSFIHTFVHANTSPVVLELAFFAGAAMIVAAAIYKVNQDRGGRHGHY